MSGKIIVRGELRDRKILKDTLEQMGLTFTENGSGPIQVQSHYGMTISETEINCDTVDRHTANEIKAQYQKNFQISQLALTGESYEVVETADKISIFVG